MFPNFSLLSLQAFSPLFLHYLLYFFLTFLLLIEGLNQNKRLLCFGLNKFYFISKSIVTPYSLSLCFPLTPPQPISVCLYMFYFFQIMGLNFVHDRYIAPTDFLCPLSLFLWLASSFFFLLLVLFKIFFKLF